MITKSQRGFTLIELVVVFTTIAILSTIGIASFVSYSRSQELNQTTSDLVQALNTAKSMSAAQLKTLNKNGSGPKGCINQNQALNGYGVQINIDKTNSDPKLKYYYYLYIQCVTSSGGTPLQKVTDPTWQTSLPSDVTINSATDTAGYNIFFPIMSGGITTTGGNSITLSNYGQTKTVEIINGYINVR